MTHCSICIVVCGSQHRLQLPYFQPSAASVWWNDLFIFNNHKPKVRFDHYHETVLRTTKRFRWKTSFTERLVCITGQRFFPFFNCLSGSSLSSRACGWHQDGHCDTGTSPKKYDSPGIYFKSLSVHQWFTFRPHKLLYYISLHARQTDPCC